MVPTPLETAVLAPPMALQQLDSAGKQDNASINVWEADKKRIAVDLERGDLQMGPPENRQAYQRQLREYQKTLKQCNEEIVSLGIITLLFAISSAFAYFTTHQILSTTGWRRTATAIITVFWYLWLGVLLYAACEVHHSLQERREKCRELRESIDALSIHTASKELQKAVSPSPSPGEGEDRPV